MMDSVSVRFAVEEKCANQVLLTSSVHSRALLAWWSTILAPRACRDSNTYWKRPLLRRSEVSEPGSLGAPLELSQAHPTLVGATWRQLAAAVRFLNVKVADRLHYALLLHQEEHPACCLVRIVSSFELPCTIMVAQAVKHGTLREDLYNQISRLPCRTCRLASWASQGNVARGASSSANDPYTCRCHHPRRALPASRHWHSCPFCHAWRFGPDDNRRGNRAMSIVANQHCLAHAAVVFNDGRCHDIHVAPAPHHGRSESAQRVAMLVKLIPRWSKPRNLLPYVSEEATAPQAPSRPTCRPRTKKYDPPKVSRWSPFSSFLEKLANCETVSHKKI